MVANGGRANEFSGRIFPITPVAFIINSPCEVAAIINTKVEGRATTRASQSVASGSLIINECLQNCLLDSRCKRRMKIPPCNNTLCNNTSFCKDLPICNNFFHHFVATLVFGNILLTPLFKRHYSGPIHGILQEWV